MKIIRLEAVTDDVLTSTNASEAVAPYSTVWTYMEGDEALNTADQSIYESQVDSNLNQSLTDPTKWLRSRPANPWAMFDNFNQTQTSRADNITVGLKPDGRTTGGSAAMRRAMQELTRLFSRMTGDGTTLNVTVTA